MNFLLFLWHFGLRRWCYVGRAMSDFLKIYVPLSIFVFVAFVVTYQYVDPAPPTSIKMATGPSDGAYAAFGQQYKKILGKEGISVDLIETEGSEENIGLLSSTNAGVDVAIVQGGIGDAKTSPSLASLASLYHEPLWVFVRGDPPAQTLAELDTYRVAIGPEGSGTRTIALKLLRENGIGSSATELWSIGGQEAANALLTGQIDAAIFVAAETSPAIQGLLKAPDIDLMNFERAEAYHRLFPFLSNVSLPQGILDLDKNLPRTDVTLLAPAANLVARDSVHPAISDLLLTAAAQIHGPATLFERAGSFPSPKFVHYPISPDAKRFLEQGPTFLHSVLPFWAATMSERLFILLLPLLTLLIPLVRVAPPAYRWQVRRRIYRWYADLMRIEDELRRARTFGDRRESLEQLDELQGQIGRVQVPLSFTDDLFHLRHHVDFVKKLFSRNSATMNDGTDAMLLTMPAPTSGGSSTSGTDDHDQSAPASMGETAESDDALHKSKKDGDPDDRKLRADPPPSDEALSGSKTKIADHHTSHAYRGGQVSNDIEPTPNLDGLKKRRFLRPMRKKR